MPFNPENTEKLGKRTIEEGELDPIIQAEAVKISKWAHHDAIIGAKTVLGLTEDEELSKEQISTIKHAVFNNKYQYLLKQENNVDPY